MKNWLFLAVFPLLALGCGAAEEDVGATAVVEHAETVEPQGVVQDAAAVEDSAVVTEAPQQVVSPEEESSAGEVAPQEVHNPVVLATAGPVSAEILARVKNWGESQLAIPVPVVESLDVKGESFDEVAEAAGKRLAPEDLGVVVLLLSEMPLPNHGVYRPDLRVVVVNVNLMEEGADAEKFGRRMERQVIRGIGTLMGLELSPNPQSAMAMYSNMDELDQIGRNLDPPWLLRLQNRAIELGIPVDPDNPYNMIRE
ncbi:MAG: hypothetical protein H3C50_01450 [Kiritimatiellae bacterium]|nr:hypothetical protein [Kiritimatiellia bacterium]